LTNQRSASLRQSCTEQSRALFGIRVARLLKTRATRHVTLATLSREKTRATKLREKIAGVTSVLATDAEYVASSANINIWF